MGFYIQYSCDKCGYKSPEENGVLIDPLGIPDLYICSCRNCHSLFHRKSDKQNNVINACPNCGNENIQIHEDVYHMPCPCCDNEELKGKCIGTFF